KGDDFNTYIAKAVENPTEKMMKDAIREADYDTFTKELGQLGKSAQKFLENIPIAKFVIAPFLRTPVNLLKFAGERTVLSIASKEVRDILAGKKGNAARDEQMAKIILGTSVTATSFLMAEKGLMTGNGPRDPQERAAWLMEHQPYSVRIGDGWYSYQRLEPYATWMGIAAD